METPVKPLHSRAGTPILPRCPRARSAAHPRPFSRCEARNLCYLCLKEQRKEGERAIARSMNRLHRGFKIHDYYAGQSLGHVKRWVKTSLTVNLRRRLTDLASQSIWGL